MLQILEIFTTLQKDLEMSHDDSDKNTRKIIWKLKVDEDE